LIQSIDSFDHCFVFVFKELRRDHALIIENITTLSLQSMVLVCRKYGYDDIGMT